MLYRLTHPPGPLSIKRGGGRGDNQWVNRTMRMHLPGLHRKFHVTHEMVSLRLSGVSRRLSEPTQGDDADFAMRKNFDVTLPILRCYSSMEGKFMKHQRYFFPYSRTRLILPLLGLLLLAPLYGVIAQPSLNFKRVTVNWPTIEVYFNVDCGGEPFTNLTKDNFRITENGVDVGDFTLWCPDTRGIRCAVSLGLVLDASGSMGGAAGLEASAIAGYLIDLLGEPYDEAALVIAGANAQVAADMTTDKSRLRDGLASYAPFGSSAFYDGVYAGVMELINNGVNQCRSIIVVSDGEDNASTHTMADVIALANRHRLRVFTIGTGPIMQEDSLANLARLTGGHFLKNPTLRNMLDLYDEVTRTMWDWPQIECVITYERGCADGSLRTVDMQLRDVCGGSDAKSKQ